MHVHGIRILGCAHARQDLHLAMDAAAAVDSAVPMGEHTKRVFQQVAQAPTWTHMSTCAPRVLCILCGLTRVGSQVADDGWSDKDFGSVYRWLEGGKQA